jgi:hypothetical protein
MDELLSQVIKKTSLSPALAQTVVKIVVDFLKRKLPAPLSAQIDAALSNSPGAPRGGVAAGDISSKWGGKS